MIDKNGFVLNTVGTSASPRVITNEQGPIAPTDSQYSATDDVSSVLDKSWVQNAFMVPDVGFTDKDDKSNRYYTSARMKFTDTRLGASIGINPRPQYCQYSDVPVKGRLPRNDPGIHDTSGNYGMGRQYSEFIDDPAQRIYMCFGVPEYNSLIGFLMTAYESNQMALARTGRASSVFYKAGNLIGTGAILVSFPRTVLTIFAGKLFSYFISRPKSKFYTMKPTMHLYWSAVNQLVQAMSVNRGIMPKFLADEEDQKIGQNWKFDNEYLKALSDTMPDVFRDAGLGNTDEKGASVPIFDIYSVATKAQRIANKVLANEFDELNKDPGKTGSYSGYVKRTMTTAETIDEPELVQKVDGETGLLQTFYDSISNIVSFVMDKTTDIDTDPRTRRDKDDPKKMEENAFKEVDGYYKYVLAQVRDGALFATFIVDYTGPQQESWSSSTGESDLANKLNGQVAEFAAARFSLAEGNIIGGIAGDVLGAAAGAVTNLASGVASGITMGLSDTLRGLAGAGYIDIPKHWQGSSFAEKRSSYSVQLISPYGNPISQLMAIDIPLAMLMAAALPRSIGKAAYTSPFLCQIYDRGRCQIRLGLVDSLSFNRGTSHLGFTDTGAALSVDVNFSVVDLSSIMHMPLTNGKFGEIDISSDDDNILQDYLAVLAGMSIDTQIYDIPRAKIKFAKAIMNAGRFTGPGYYASVFNTTPVAEFMRIFTKQSAAIDPRGISPGAE